jgi:hypothetical protein
MDEMVIHNMYNDNDLGYNLDSNTTEDGFLNSKEKA